MSTAGSLINRIRAIVKTTSLAVVRDDNLLDMLNRGVEEVAGLVLLPDLATFSTVNTSVNDPYVNMPNNYHRKLHTVYSAKQKCNLNIETSWIKFLEKYPGLKCYGNISDVVISGNRLYYQPQPSQADTLTLFYYRKPTAMTSSSSSPDGIPSHLHEAILVSFVVSEIFKFEGHPEQRRMFEVYYNQYQEAIGTLQAFIGDQDNAPNYIRETTVYYTD